MDGDKVQFYSVLSNKAIQRPADLSVLLSHRKQHPLLLKRKKKYLKLLTHGRPSTSDIRQIIYLFFYYIFGNKEYEIALFFA